jgi:hypothetical protein
VNSVELCQVGIEHRHKVQLEELCCESRQKPESLRILWSSARWALSRCEECTEEELYCEFRRNRIIEDSVKLCQVGIEQVHRGTG